MSPAQTSPAISAAIVDGDLPGCSSHRSLGVSGPNEAMWSAVSFTFAQVPASVRPSTSASTIGNASPSSSPQHPACCGVAPPTPLTGEYLGNEPGPYQTPSPCVHAVICWRFHSHWVIRTACARSPAASRPVACWYRSRDQTRWYPSFSAFPSTVSPHGVASAATFAPGNVLSSLACSAITPTRYVRRRRVSPETLAGGGASPARYPCQPARYPDSTAANPAASDAPAAAAAAPRSAPKPSARVNVVSAPAVTWAVCTMFRPLFAVFVTVYSRALSSGIDTACVVASRSRSTKDIPSVTTYCMSCRSGTSARG